MQSVELAPGYRVSRVIRGNWQLAGGHGPVDAEAAVADLVAYADAGITTFDGWAATFGQTVTSIELAPAGQTFR